VYNTNKLDVQSVDRLNSKKYSANLWSLLSDYFFRILAILVKNLYSKIKARQLDHRRGKNLRLAGQLAK
jgi:hypothetical protein